MWVGIPKAAGCLEGWRYFFDFLNILGCVGGRGRAYQLEAPNPASRRYAQLIFWSAWRGIRLAPPIAIYDVAETPTTWSASYTDRKPAEALSAPWRYRGYPCEGRELDRILVLIRKSLTTRVQVLRPCIANGYVEV